MWQLKKHIHAAMMQVFRVNPSLRLYTALVNGSTDPTTTEDELLRYLTEMGTSGSDAFAATLEIHKSRNDNAALVRLLSSHPHLLRPRDATVLQAVTQALAADPMHHAHALALIEKEMLDIASAVRAALTAPFALLDTPENAGELEQILKLRPSAAGRQDRVERWVNAVMAPGTNVPNPLALAAAMMGLPMPVMDGVDDGDGMIGLLDFDQHDPDLEDLREEFRPKLKQRFQGWSDTAVQVRGGPAVLLKVYKDIVKSMPFLRANDIVEELLSR